MINFNMNFQFTPEEMRKINTYVRRGLLFDIKAKLIGAVPHIEKIIRPEIERRVAASDVIDALRNGKLRAQLGLQPGEAEFITNKIPAAIARSLKVRVALHNESVDFIAEIVTDIIREILDYPEASFIQTYTTGKQSEIRWLEWLLTKGDTIIVADFRVKYTPGNPKSRSGEAIMLPGSGFRISPEFSGVDGDNFLTRALEGIDGFILEEVKKFL